MPTNWTAENIPYLTGKVAIVTGANSGIGYEMARALARKQATVILACRNMDNGAVAVQQITQEYPAAKVEIMPLDLSDLASVRRFAAEFARQHDRLACTPMPRTLRSIGAWASRSYRMVRPRPSR